MAAVTICGDFGAQENSLSLFPLFPHLFGESDAIIFVWFFICILLFLIFN